MWDEKTRPTKLLTFRSGGWVLVLTAIFALVILLVVLWPALGRRPDRPPGDGRDPASYGFVLEPSLVPVDELQTAQLHRDLIVALVEPTVMNGADVEAWNREQRGKYLVPSDLVIGVELDGAARAYPLLVMASHGIVNDRLGERRIAVTYDPLCDSAVVFDRDAGDAVLELGVSGLLYNANLLMYDRRAENGAESLWSQLQARAIAGPAAGRSERLVVLPAVVTRWDDWLNAHPATTVLRPDEHQLRAYRGNNFDAYQRTETLWYPVRPAPPADGWRAKTPCLVVLADDGDGPRRLYPLPFLSARADEQGAWRDELGGRSLLFHVDPDGRSARVVRADDGRPVPAMTGFWFAWHAMDPAIDAAARAPDA